MKGSSTDDIYIQLHCAPIAARSRARKIINDAGRGIIVDTTNGNETESVCNIIVAEDGCVFFHGYCANRHGRDLDLRKRRIRLNAFAILVSTPERVNSSTSSVSFVILQSLT